MRACLRKGLPDRSPLKQVNKLDKLWRKLIDVVLSRNSERGKVRDISVVATPLKKWDIPKLIVCIVY